MEEIIVIGGKQALALPLKIYEKLKDLENEFESFPFVEDHDKARITGRQTFEDFAIIFNKVNLASKKVKECTEELLKLGNICKDIQPLDYSLLLKIKSPTNPNLRKFKSKKRC